MNRPTPTEVHLDLALQIAEALARSGNVAAAQLIADSEARAIAKQVEALAILTLRWDKVEKEQGQLRARAERAEAKLAAASQAYECAMAIHGTVMEERDRLAAELTAERARLDYLLQWDVTFHDRADIDAELSYAQRKKSTPTLP
jgi:hypothetical protein